MGSGNTIATQRGNARHEEPAATPVWLGACLLFAIALFLLREEHRAHFLGALPYVLLLLCPVIHLFLHRGHGDHAGHTVHRDLGSP